MNKATISIHEFEFDLICEYFSGIERQGPGSPEVTIKALRFIDHLSDGSRIADIGCGTGGQTRVLARHASGHITGLDLFPAFIEQFNESAVREDLQHRVHGNVASMDQFPFQQEELDLIWSEGAIYNIGFELGLHEWQSFLKPGGYLAVSEASWFTEERPDEIDKFWQNAHPEIDTIPRKVIQLQKAGYVPVATFILPESCWTDHYYKPQIPVQQALLEKYNGNSAAEDFIANQRHEAQLYEKYKQYYGYAFYIGKKV
jgi:SAM-dependent methyltransferase